MDTATAAGMVLDATHTKGSHHDLPLQQTRLLRKRRPDDAPHLAELLASPQKVRAGAATGRAFVFGGVVFSPAAQPSQRSRRPSRSHAQLTAFARSYCRRRPSISSRQPRRKHGAAWPASRTVTVSHGSPSGNSQSPPC
jgi:hypothetical protein